MTFQLIRQVPEEVFEDKGLAKFEKLDQFKRQVTSLLQRRDLSAQQKLSELAQLTKEPDPTMEEEEEKPKDTVAVVEKQEMVKEKQQRVEEEKPVNWRHLSRCYLYT